MEPLLYSYYKNNDDYKRKITITSSLSSFQKKRGPGWSITIRISLAKSPDIASIHGLSTTRGIKMIFLITFRTYITPSNSH